MKGINKVNSEHLSTYTLGKKAVWFSIRKCYAYRQTWSLHYAENTCKCCNKRKHSICSSSSYERLFFYILSSRLVDY